MTRSVRQRYGLWRVKCSLRSPLPISIAFRKTNFPTLCTFCRIASQIHKFSWMKSNSQVFFENLLKVQRLPNFASQLSFFSRFCSASLAANPCLSTFTSFGCKFSVFSKESIFIFVGRGWELGLEGLSPFSTLRSNYPAFAPFPGSVSSTTNFVIS